MLRHFLLQCYSAKALFSSFSIDSSGLNQESFEKICPAIVEQIESEACAVKSEEEDEEEITQSKTKGKYLLLSLINIHT